MMSETASILVVEDEVGTRATLCAILEDAGYKVTGLGKGAAALEMIRSCIPNVIISDIRLPDVGGLEILELAKEINPDVAVIMMTGYASIETAVNAVNDGAYAYFVKPINPDEVKTAIANAVRQQRLSLENKRLVDDLQRSNRLLFEANEELRRATQAKSEFLAHMSHELRTPLNVIIGFSELMLDKVPGEINEEQRHCLGDVLDSGKHLLNIINDVLDLSKVESGKMELRLRRVVLGRVINSLRSTMMPILAQRRQSLDIEVEDGLPPVHADEARIKQVLLNLLSNSAKFTPDAGKLEIKATRDGDWCRVSVIDNGIGIKREDQRRIFEPFCQLDNPLPREKSGSGLGLTVAKQIVENHSGRIWVESEHGKGSQFIFTIPLAIAVSHIQEEKQAVNGKILVVEDNPQNMRTIEMTLRARGYILLKAIDGEEALDVAVREQPDLIIMDIQLPKMSGLEVTRKLREMPAFSNIPIVAITAYAMKGDRETAINAGCDAYLPKPINTRELPEVIAGMLLQRQKDNI